MQRSFVRALLLPLVGVLLAAAPAAAKLNDKTWTQAKHDLEQALAGTEAEAVVKAIEAIGGDGTRRAAELLVAVGASDKLSAPEVYDAVLAALRGMADSEAQAYLTETLDRKTDGKQWPLRCVICEALATIDGAEATRALAGRLKDNTPYVISAAAKALGRRRDKAGVDGLVKALADLERKKDVTWVDVREALNAICGMNFSTAAEWEKFWTAEGASFDPAKKPTDAAKTDATTISRDEARFFTEVIISKRIMFIIDISGSMKEQDIPVDEEGDTVGRKSTTKASRIDVAKKALVACIKDLKPDVKFNIVAFSTDVVTWRPSKQGLQSADSTSKADAIRWVKALEADGATETDKALKEAFENVDVNTIVLLSDGQPMRAVGGPGPGPGGPGGGQRGGPGGGGRGGRGRGEEIEPKEILDLVKVLNRLRGVKIHTFCFKVFDEMRPGFGFDPQKCLDFLKKLAEENGGKLSKV